MEVAWVVHLALAVHDHHVIAVSVAHTDVPGGAGEPSWIGEKAQVIMAAFQLFDDCSRRVHRVSVDDQDFKSFFGIILVEEALNCLPDKKGLITYRQDD